jgi:hypothetical protein
VRVTTSTRIVRSVHARTLGVRPAAAAVAASLLLSVAGDGRYLQNGSGQPFMPWGPSVWLAPHQLANTFATVGGNPAGDPAGVAASLAAGQATMLGRFQSLGFNALTIMAVSKYGDDPPNDTDGVAPFTTPGNFATFNATYFNKLKAFINLAATFNFVCFLAPLWVGYEDSQGFSAEIVASSDSAMTTYGETIGALLEPCDNIVWIIGGDKQAPVSGTIQSRCAALAQGIDNVDGRHLRTSHWNFALGDNPSNALWQDIISCYDWNGGNVYDQVRQAYAANPNRCYWVAEAFYDRNTQYAPGGESLERVLRRQSAQSILAGARGNIFGDEALWHMGSKGLNVAPQSQGKPYDLFRPSFTHQRRIREFFAALPWWRLRPDVSSNLVTSGRGSPGSADYVTASVTVEEDAGGIYLPDAASSIGVDCGVFASPVDVAWVDPTSGAEFSAGTNLTGAQSFSRGANAAGDPDWLLRFTV